MRDLSRGFFLDSESSFSYQVVYYFTLLGVEILDFVKESYSETDLDSDIETDEWLSLDELLLYIHAFTS